MSKLARLKPFKEPPPPPKEACAACEAFAPTCLVPVGDAAVPMCWLCAHHVIDHEVAPHHANTAECECLPEQIYPNRIDISPRWRAERSAAVATVGKVRLRRKAP